MRTSASPSPALGELLAGNDYVRRRLAPRIWDLDYLVLTDLRDLVEHLAARVRGRLFDYGCGAAPYRSYFRQCSEYIGADVTPGPHIDRLLEADGSTTEPDGSYDVVLSTQVLEHVQYPKDYLRECHRILRPGGTLLLSTHGMVQEHGCPFDFFRWTSRGLETLVTEAGFDVKESVKFTTEIRGVVQLLHHFVDHLRCPNILALRYALAGLRRLYYWLCMPGLNWFGARLRQQGIVPSSDPASLYVGVCVVATKR